MTEHVFESDAEFLEWLEDFEPSVNDDKPSLSGFGNSQVAGSGIVK